MESQDHAKLLLDTIPQVMRIIRTQMREVAGDEFTVPQYRILRKVSLGASSNGELADWMGVSAPTMSKMIDKLAKRGYISRKTEGADRRQVRLSCTKKGLERAGEIRGAVLSTLSEKISSLPEKKRRTLSDGLEVLRELFL